MYKLLKSPLTQEVTGVTFIGEGYQLSIPFNPDNTDYQAYLKWVEEGNTPLPADEE